MRTIAASGQAESDEEKSEADASSDDPDIPALKLSPSQLRNVLEPPADARGDSSDSQEDANAMLKRKLRKSAKKLTRKEDYGNSMDIGRAVWSTPAQRTSAADKACPGHMYADNYKEHIAARRENEREADQGSAPFDMQRHAAAIWHAYGADATLDSAYNIILQEKERPNQMQKEFLDHFVHRLHVEILEARQQIQDKSLQEPLLDLMHGFPGTGKSRVIGWMRRLMEEGLGWQHGVQFACLAFQNAMAAQINGNTIHHWSGIPTRAIDGNATGDRHKQSIKCQALRVIILDELSMISAELFGALSYVLGA